jgi:DNA-3-methyladenine glycosylase
MNQPLPSRFYNRPTVLVAQELLGKFLVRHIDDEVLIGKIVETEAYLGVDDPAAHSFIGRTKRTRILFEEAGRAYVFQLRAYYLLNVVTEAVDTPTCVLLRALEPIQGAESIRQTLGSPSLKETQLMNGPGKLCRALQINMSHYGTDFTSIDSPFYITEGENGNFQIEATTRIGISKAADKPYRFTIKGNRFTSK